MNMKTHLIFVLIIFFGLVGNTQEVNVEKGCIPLRVEFTPPVGMSSYYWDFVEGGASSVEENPEHIFTNPGVYEVLLYEGLGGNLIGSVEITVFEEPIIDLIVDNQGGCSPLKVNFTSNVTLHDSIILFGSKWAFGDGNQSNSSNPGHTYTNSGEFDVAFTILTNYEGCNTTILKDKWIKVKGVSADFVLDNYYVCETPAVIQITNETELDPSYLYEWTLPNGKTSNEHSPSSITIENEGEYEVILTVTNEEGCISTKKRNVVVGKPQFNIDPPEVVCLNELVEFNNSSVAQLHIWTIKQGNTQQIYNTKNPDIAFVTSGMKEVTLELINGSNCSNDTTFTILVENPDATFKFDPYIICQSPKDITLQANDGNHKTYEWESLTRKDILVSSGNPTTIEFEDLERDSFYWNHADTLWVNLKIESEHGCEQEYEDFFVLKRPNAHFLPNKTRGCAPLQVHFEDANDSWQDVEKITYEFGDGNEETFLVEGVHSHTYMNAGDYWVRSIIENSHGCIDTSAWVKIHVGEKIEPDFTLDKTEICIEESIDVTFYNSDPRIDALHLYTDDGRFTQCWKEKTASHFFTASPGEYQVKGVVEYNGCYTEKVHNSTIKVNGARADLNYMIDCRNPFEVMLKDSSINASNLIWSIDTTIVEDEVAFVHSFTNEGTYSVVLEASDEQSGCPSTYDSVEVHIVDIQASFSIPELVCENQEYELDASASHGVDTDCYSGFLWYTPSDRPIETSESILETSFPAGEQEVTLVVHDINGCRDTISKETRSFAIKSDFVMDKEEVCLPAQINLMDQSSSDTTLTKFFYNWQIDSIESKNHILDLMNELNEGDQLTIIHTIENEIGCIDQSEKTLSIYKPKTIMTLDKAGCVGDSLSFMATDFKEKGSFLHFTWSFQDKNLIMDQSGKVTYDENGHYNVELIIEEDQSGCRDTLYETIQFVDLPIADFITSADSQEVLCHPLIIDFNNKSIVDGPIVYTWLVDRGDNISNLEDVSFAFSKGHHEVQLLAQSPYGCADTITRFFQLVGPEGEVETDKTDICIGEEITFSLVNSVDVQSYEWDFGEGTVVEDISPISHLFDREQSTTAKLILKSKEYECDLVIEIPLNIESIHADFVQLDTNLICPGLGYFINISQSNAKFNWVLDGEIKSSFGDTIEAQFPGAGVYDVTLEAESLTSTCKESITKEVTIEDIRTSVRFPNLFTPNEDGENDVFRPIFEDPSWEDRMEIVEFKVYNRWGNLVYDNDDVTLGWNGEFRGERAPSEVYAFYMAVEIDGCQKFEKKGSVTLIR